MLLWVRLTLLLFLVKVCLVSSALGDVTIFDLLDTINSVAGGTPSDEVSPAPTTKPFNRPTVKPGGTLSKHLICLFKSNTSSGAARGRVLSDVEKVFGETNLAQPRVTVLNATDGAIFDNANTTDEGLELFENLLRVHADDILDCTANALLIRVPKIERVAGTDTQSSSISEATADSLNDGTSISILPTTGAPPVNEFTVSLYNGAERAQTLMAEYANSVNEWDGNVISPSPAARTGTQVRVLNAFIGSDFTSETVNKERTVVEDGSRETGRDAIDLAVEETAVAYVVGCDCYSFPDGMACPLSQILDVQVVCEAHSVWNNQKQGAELIDVVRSIDAATTAGTDVVVFPLWFDGRDPNTPRAAPRVLRGVIQRANSQGVLFAVPAGDEGVTFGTTKYASVVQPTLCGDRGGLDILCVASLDPKTGWPSLSSNIPFLDSVYAAGEQVTTLGIAKQPIQMSGTYMSLAQGVGALNLMQGVWKAAQGGLISPSEQLGMLVNPRRQIVTLPYSESIKQESSRRLEGLRRRIPGTVLDAGYALENAMFLVGAETAEIALASCYLNNVKFSGEEIDFARTDNTESCQVACNGNSSCRYFSFNRQQKLCHLFQEVSGSSDFFGGTSGPRACPLPSSAEARVEMGTRLLEGMTSSVGTQKPGAATPISEPQPKMLDLLRQAVSPTSGAASGGNPTLGQDVLTGMQTAANTATTFMNLWQTTTTLMETGGQLLETFPIEELVSAGSQAYNSGLLRDRGIGSVTSALGLQKQSVMPPPGVGVPEVKCMDKGMACCVPRKAAENHQRNPPRLNDEESDECTAQYVSISDELCATTLYEGTDTCNMQVIEANTFIIYQNVLTMPGRSMNNAICACKRTKSPEEGSTSVSTGSATWEYSLQGIQTEGETRDGSLLEGATTALGWAKMVGEVGAELPAAVSGLGEVIQQVQPQRNTQTYEIIAQVPGLSQDAGRRRRRRLSSTEPDRKLRRVRASSMGDGEGGRANRLFGETGVEARNGNRQWFSARRDSIELIGSDIGGLNATENSSKGEAINGNETYSGDFDVSDHCFTPWPEKCMAWRSECEENGEREHSDGQCDPVTLIEAGCPQEQMNFTIHDQQPGVLSYSFKAFQFAQGAPFRVGCKYRLTQCREAQLKKKCASRSPGAVQNQGFATGVTIPGAQNHIRTPSWSSERIRMLTSHFHLRGKPGPVRELNEPSAAELIASLANTAVSALTQEGKAQELRLFDSARDKRVNKFSIVHFSGIGDVLLGQWVDQSSGELLGVAEVESTNPSKINSIREEVERGDFVGENLRFSGIRRKSKSMLTEMLTTVDEMDLVDFSWVSKIEILPHLGSDMMLLDKFQKTEGEWVEEKLIPTQVR
eukprot:GHVN01002188.1.p1 GENE.GHVN01002188.1~~GHVN01002188.1.p1  ORF type:complete len:1366 (-),score=169.85 GHVN01002188.1:9589-13686(-)